ncbi:MAG: hypothetical protein MMC23_002957 [Stictis urceolatum]|nr:hypothetical protein [Stictis urceolata]
MAPIALSDIIQALPTEDTWGPSITSESLVDGVPYAPYSKGDKLGRMADWTSGGKDSERGGRQAYQRNYRDQQVYGAGTSSLFAVQVAEDESSFSVVDNTRPSTRTRGFGRGGGTVFRGRGRGQQTQRGGRGTLQRNTGGRGGQQGQYFDNRGGRGRGGRRFGGWKDYDKPQRNRDSSVQIKPDWSMLEEIDFKRLQNLNLDTGAGEDLDAYGFLYYYDRTFDKAPVKNTERKLNIIERTSYNVSTSYDPVIQEMADKDEATIFATDSILSMLMCSPRSVYSWDLVINRRGNKIFLDKRDGSALDLVSVNENAADAPLEASEGNKDTINFPGALAEEATMINLSFANQVVMESDSSRYDFEHSNPFSNPSEETEPLASKGYRYRRFDLSLERDEEPFYLVVRSELDAVVKNNISGEDQFMTIKALNEFDHKAQGSGGALDWRAKLSSQRGAVVATEMKNNSCKLARWTTQSIIAKADLMKIGFVSRAAPKINDRHVILGVMGYDPRKFGDQLGINLNNGWGIVRTIVDMVLGKSDGTRDVKYVLVKDPNKAVLRLYEVPLHTFEEGEDDDVGDVGDGEGGSDAE